MSTSPAYAGTPNVGSDTVTSGDTSLTAPAAAKTIFTAGANGSRIERINIKAIGTTVASMLRFFLHDGTNFHLFHEELVPALAPTSAIKSWEKTLEAVTAPNLLPILLKNGWTLRVTVNDTQTSSGICVTATGGDF